MKNNIETAMKNSSEKQQSYSNENNNETKEVKPTIVQQSYNNCSTMKDMNETLKWNTTMKNNFETQQWHTTMKNNIRNRMKKQCNTRM